jgi:hypothetical protein
MKKTLTIFFACIISNSIIAQTTAIPDSNFEQALINLGLDFTLDGTALTTNIDTLTTLNVSGKFISDLTGIEDFTALTFLNCRQNSLTNLEVSQNTALTYLNCSLNQLTSLDFSQNISLEDLLCGENQLTSLNISQNTALTYLSCSSNQLINLNVSQNTALILLSCYNNQLTNLDVSQNTDLDLIGCSNNQLNSLDLSYNHVLTHFYGEHNQLNCLNIKNGNNSNMAPINTTYNTNLMCITVDDITYSNTTWTNIDTQTSFSENCANPCTVSIDENSLLKTIIYPNPTSRSINIDLEEIKSNVNLRLTNALGQVELVENYKSTNHISFDLDKPKGIYFLQLKTSNGEVITRKIIKE